MLIYNLFRRKYDLREESTLAGFGGNVDHFKSYLAHCPKHAMGKYGSSKYVALRKQVGLSENLSESNISKAG
jgi:hypothetical protein